MKTIRKKCKDQHGFTLIEMIVVLFIVSLLMLLMIPGVAKQQEKATETGTNALQSVLQAQVDLYQASEKTKATSFEDLKAKKYLTDKQLQEANASFTFTGGDVTKKAGAGGE